MIIGGSQMWYILKIWIYYIKVGANASTFFCACTESGTTGFRLSGQAADIWKLILNFALWFERYLDSETWNMKLSYRPVYQKCIYYGNQSSCLGKQGRARADGFRLETVLEEMTSTWVFVIEVHGINYCQMLDSCPDVLSALVTLEGVAGANCL